MVETLQPLTLAGECRGRRWWVGYVCPYRYAITGIELEVAAGQRVPIPNPEGGAWASMDEMLAAIERRLRAHLDGVPVVHAFAA